MNGLDDSNDDENNINNSSANLNKSTSGSGPSPPLPPLNNGGGVTLDQPTTPTLSSSNNGNRDKKRQHRQPLLSRDDDDEHSPDDNSIELREINLATVSGSGSPHNNDDFVDEAQSLMSETPDNKKRDSRGTKDVQMGELHMSPTPDASLKISNSDITPPITRQQWIRVIVIYTAVLSDGLSLTLVQPFLPKLLMEKWHFSESDVGWVSGILIGCYSLARFFSAFVIGHLSDKYGRKPFLVLSLLSTTIGTAIFAFMPNVYLAMLVRFVEGLVSNTTALSQATLADMIDKRNRATIFAYLGAIFALSRCLSSTLGGVVVRLADGQPNPYIYPCLVGGGIVFVSAVLIFFIHPETHPRFAKPGVSATEISKDQDAIPLWEGLKSMAKDRKIVMLLILGSVNSFNNGGLLLAFVLFSSLSIEHRGLGMDPFENGIIFSVLGFFGFIFQITFFKRLSRTLGLKRQYLMGSMLLCLGMMTFPLTFMGYLIQGKATVWVILMIIVPITSVGFMQCLPIVGGMIANASRPELQGLTQGTAQSANSLLRSFGPAISGAIFTFSIKYSVSWLLFFVLSVIYVGLAILSLYLPDSVDVLRDSENKANANNKDKKMKAGSHC
ncbi:hypothetical protein SAMD00019534_053100 [Acytostelium subglobosum LB1]|uniref:hypothetical protein n=1 Tax=Acytostelium subglobosum LB1 TaxID=1410327 RepID=UPI0006450827|nr:hypothetical protein SAMD00019534_053100 [Acytostelium subglobosum LB1]GAM22135.1 hypothetical protein SAMD00019534_053100 [Acytostelium subglobosum LB1]|eukprot:XP_012755235.1 hypothetical protein SAMD00019534_053100 [Acytostelium subglobosum LB1]